MPVTLKNVSGRIQQIQLDHPLAPKMRQTYKQTSLNKRSGKVGVRMQKLSVPQSLILLAGETRENLPMWVVEIPKVKRLIETKKLQAIVIVEADKPKSKKQRRSRRRASSKKSG